jgi:hypothetical protein
LKPGGFKLWVNCIQRVHMPTATNGLAAGVLVLVRHVDASDGLAFAIFEEKRVVRAEPRARGVDGGPTVPQPVLGQVRAASRVGLTSPGVGLVTCTVTWMGYMHGYRVSSNWCFACKINNVGSANPHARLPGVINWSFDCKIDV